MVFGRSGTNGGTGATGVTWSDLSVWVIAVFSFETDSESRNGFYQSLSRSGVDLGGVLGVDPGVEHKPRSYRYHPWLYLYYPLAS
jgi:hypothetical protein